MDGYFELFPECCPIHYISIKGVCMYIDLGSLIPLASGGACTTIGVGAGGKGFGLFTSSILFIFRQTSLIVCDKLAMLNPGLNEELLKLRTLDDKIVELVGE